MACDWMSLLPERGGSGMAPSCLTGSIGCLLEDVQNGRVGGAGGVQGMEHGLCYWALCAGLFTKDPGYNVSRDLRIWGQDKGNASEEINWEWLVNTIIKAK